MPRAESSTIVEFETPEHERGMPWNDIPCGQMFSGLTRYWCGGPPYYSGSMGSGPFIKTVDNRLVGLAGGVVWTVGPPLHILGYRAFSRCALSE
jgi:hypothetical protein